MRRVALTLVAVVAAMLGLARAAQAQQITGDLDRDGKRDVISHAGSWSSVLHVRLSTSTSPRTIRTAHPLVWVNVVDINGDGRLDLVAADRNRVHIWEYRGGKLRPVRPPPSRSRARPGSNRITDRETSDDIAVSAGTDSPCDASSTIWLNTLRNELTPFTDNPCRPSSANASLPPSRAPPQHA